MQTTFSKQHLHNRLMVGLANGRSSAQTNKNAHAVLQSANAIVTGMTVAKQAGRVVPTFGFVWSCMQAGLALREVSSQQDVFTPRFYMIGDDDY